MAPHSLPAQRYLGPRLQDRDSNLQTASIRQLASKFTSLEGLAFRKRESLAALTERFARTRLAKTHLFFHTFVSKRSIGGVSHFFLRKGPDCVTDPFGTVPRKCFRQERGNAPIGKIPPKSGKSTKKLRKVPKRDKKGQQRRTSPDREPPPLFEPS